MDHPTLAPLVTFLISTRNRRDVLLGTLGELSHAAVWGEVVTETIVVDNASTDGTAAAVAAAYPDVRVVRLDRNRRRVREERRAAAGRRGVRPVPGRRLVPDRRQLGSGWSTTSRTTPQLGAAVFTVTLPDGSQECSAYPNVAIGCGTAFRAAALAEVGGLPDDFFMQAEEYDLSLRLLDAGWDVRRFDDLHVRHLKTPAARQPTRTSRLDARNNLMVATRYLPRRWVVPFAVDWARRYWWIAATKGPGHRRATAVGLAQGSRGRCGRGTGGRSGRWRSSGSPARPTSAGGWPGPCGRRVRRRAGRRGQERPAVLPGGRGVRAARGGRGRRPAGGPGRTYRGVPVVTDAAAAGWRSTWPSWRTCRRSTRRPGPSRGDSCRTAPSWTCTNRSRCRPPCPWRRDRRPRAAPGDRPPVGSAPFSTPVPVVPRRDGRPRGGSADAGEVASGSLDAERSRLRRHSARHITTPCVPCPAGRSDAVTSYGERPGSRSGTTRWYNEASCCTSLIHIFDVVVLNCPGGPLESSGNTSSPAFTLYCPRDTGATGVGQLATVPS